MLANRQAWSGVEKAFKACSRYKKTLSVQDYIFGARAAEARGDVYNTRTRLWQALQLNEDLAVMDWLWSIDTAYVETVIQADTTDQIVFVGQAYHPHMSTVLAHAQKSLAETGEFHGFLLPGKYTVDGVPLEVGFGRGLVRINTRNAVPLRKGFARR